MERLKPPTRRQILLGIGTAVAIASIMIRREEPWGYLPTDNLNSFNPPPKIMWVTHRDNSPDRIYETSQTQTNPTNRPWAEVDARLVSNLGGRNRQWLFSHSDIVGPISSDVSQTKFQPGRAGSSFDEIASTARFWKQRLFVDINDSWVNRPNISDTLSLQAKLEKLGVEYVFSSIRWDLLDVLSGQRFYTIRSEKALKRFINQQETTLTPKRTAVSLENEIANEANIQVLLNSGVQNICVFVPSNVEQAKRVIENGGNCITTNNLSLIKQPEKFDN